MLLTLLSFILGQKLYMHTEVRKNEWTLNLTRGRFVAIVSLLVASVRSLYSTEYPFEWRVIILRLDSMLCLTILEQFLYVHVTHHITQFCMKEMFGDNHIKVLITDCDETHTKW